MRKKVFFQKTGLYVLGLLTAISLVGCGSKSNYADSGAYEAKSYSESYYDNDYAYDTATEALAMEESGSDTGTITEKASEVKDNSRKLIKTVDMSVETDNLDSLLTDITQRLDSCGGYIEDSYINNGSAKYGSLRSASLSIRVPAKDLDKFLENVTSITNVITKNTNVTDVTLQYVDIEAKKTSLKAQEKRLLELLSEADSVEEIVYIEEKLTNVQYEIESAERQLRSYDNKVDYSTVTMEISEVKEYTPVVEPTRWERMTQGFVDNVFGVFEGLLDFFADIVIALPYLILWAIIILIIVLIVKAIIKGSKNRKIKKMEKEQEAIKKRYAEEMLNKEKREEANPADKE